MKSIFEPETYSEVLDRIEALTPGSSRLWGKMDVAQMLCHCQNPLEVALGKKTLKKPSWLMSWVYKSFKSAMYNDKPWKKNMSTPIEYKVVSSKDFVKEKTVLIDIITEFYQLNSRVIWDPHPVFGNFTPDQWGKLQYKHLDHHLRQFGV